MQTSQILVAAVTPLASALIAGLVALTVTHRQGRTARENWVFDKRYAAYEGSIEAALALMSGFSDTEFLERLRSLEQRSPFMNALVALELISPQAIREQSLKLQRMTNKATDGDFLIWNLVEEIDKLLAMQRDDLVPKRLR